MANKRTSRIKKVISLMLLGLLLITAALFLTGYNIWDEERANVAATEVLEQVNLPLVDDEATPDYELNPYMEMPIKTLDNHGYIGVLDIPALNISLPIMTDWSYPKLRIVPNRYLGSVYTDDMIIAGHNYRTHFGSLKLLSSGDRISFTDMDGNVFDYQVVEIEVLKGTDVQLMEDGDWDLTLFTCTIGGENRTTVRAVRINAYS